MFILKLSKPRKHRPLFVQSFTTLIKAQRPHCHDGCKVSSKVQLQSLRCNCFLSQYVVNGGRRQALPALRTHPLSTVIGLNDRFYLDKQCYVITCANKKREQHSRTRCSLFKPIQLHEEFSAKVSTRCERRHPLWRVRLG